ncbi:uncharacterized protein LOC144016402 isoform X3 [Festucalex cinctus]
MSVVNGVKRFLETESMPSRGFAGCGYKYKGVFSQLRARHLLSHVPRSQPGGVLAAMADKEQMATPERAGKQFSISAFYSVGGSGDDRLVCFLNATLSQGEEKEQKLLFAFKWAARRVQLVKKNGPAPELVLITVFSAL